MKTYLSAAAAFVVMCWYSAAGTAQPKVYSFEPPPMLPGAGTTTIAPASLVLARTKPGAQPCNPQGSVTRNGPIVTVALDFVRARFSINNPDPSDPQPNGEDPVELRSYGGCKSGPVIYAAPGDSLRVNLINRTDKDDPTCWDNPSPSLGLPPGVNCFNTTNLHTHGLHVSPAGNSDNVLLDIAPQTRFPYEVNIPADHPSGTFWYHAHRHGSTAVQVASGTAGFLLIRGNRAYQAPTPQNPKPIADIDTILHDARGVPFSEQLFLFQQIAYACFQNKPNQEGGPWQQIYTTAGLYNQRNSNDTGPNTPANSPWTCPLATPDQPVSAGVIENFDLQLFSPIIWDTNGRFTSINGIVQPTLTVPAGQIQRWRFGHAGIHDTINVQIVRAAPVRATNLIAASALTGNRQQQKADLLTACNATPATLIPQFEIATDGLTRTRLHTIHASTTGGVLESNYLQPGYRSDILVVFPSDGDYCLLNQAAPPLERVNSSNGGGQGPSTPQLLAYIHVRGGKPVTTNLQAYVQQALFDDNQQLPAPVRAGLRKGDLRPWAPFDELAPATGNQQQAAFRITSNGAFQINNASYDPNVVNITREVNTTDDWILTSQGEPHIFHIHVNPFEVIDVQRANANGQMISIFNADGTCNNSVAGDQQQLANQYCGMYHTFRDTIFVENGYEIRIRTHYERYIGEYVLHCHILDHEDAGMMLNVAIVPNLNSPGGGLGMAAMRHASSAH